MAWMNELGRRIKMLFRREQFDRDLTEEMRLHRELRERDAHDDGASPDDARFAASYLPARRASRLDPMHTLREQ